MAVVILTTNGGKVQAVYNGGAYIDITFGEREHATEVINVYDYAEGKSNIPTTAKAVERELIRWLCQTNPEIEIYERRLVG
jgi:hypothetical protein